MNELIMKEKKTQKKVKKQNRNLRTSKQKVTNREMQEKIDELVSLLFEKTEKGSPLKERKGK